MAETKEEMTDLELVYAYCEKCVRFIDPFLFNQIRRRGLYDYINALPSNVDERKVVAYNRMLRDKKVFGDDEIDYIAQRISELNKLRDQLNQIGITESHIISDILSRMVILNTEVRDYLK